MGNSEGSKILFNWSICDRFKDLMSDIEETGLKESDFRVRFTHGGAWGGEGETRPCVPTLATVSAEFFHIQSTLPFHTLAYWGKYEQHVLLASPAFIPLGSLFPLALRSKGPGFSRFPFMEKKKGLNNRPWPRVLVCFRPRPKYDRHLSPKARFASALSCLWRWRHHRCPLSSSRPPSPQLYPGSVPWHLLSPSQPKLPTFVFNLKKRKRNKVGVCSE